ncbi:MAG: CooT family nickel-binding protein [Actinobacteria bacterium]|nr:CooT family nickel-binding protein [Actinomycetota bacterium]MBU1943384.1 CooT family nickel-binding protein [Actinomycetota bacterium]MBU2686741.1 CooT family nickel-binding protein [Actinomycetota bacterium]
MCEAAVFVVRGGERHKVMENVVTVTPEGGQLLLTDLFGEQKLITAKVEKVDLTGHEIILSQ